jgi:ribosome biogenesis GTPase
VISAAGLTVALLISQGIKMNNEQNLNKEYYDINTGVVFKKSTGRYHVHSNGWEIPCTISSKLRRELIYPTADPSSIRPHVVDVRKIKVTDPVAIGDNVKYINAGDGTGMILEVLPRKNKLVRPDLDSSRHTPEWKLLEQVIVANVDQVIPVFSILQPKPKWDLLDRYLVSSESLELNVRICITKMDLAADMDPGLLGDLEVYERIGYRVLLTSAKTGEGIDELKADLKDNVSVFIGKSGVGKTSLLNAMEPGLGLRVKEISRVTGKGKHTTTALEMFPLISGGSFVDTPGMREFGLWQIGNSDLATLFPEMRPYVGLCRYGIDCSHTHEPGCAIKDVVDAGDISLRRYLSYLKLRK